MVGGGEELSRFAMRFGTDALSAVGTMNPYDYP